MNKILFCEINTDEGVDWYDSDRTRNNSADSVSSSILRSPLGRIITIAGIIYYTCSLVIDIQCTRYKQL